MYINYCYKQYMFCCSDQRMTYDTDKVCFNASKMLAPLVISPFTIAYYIYKAQEGYVLAL